MNAHHSHSSRVLRTPWRHFPRTTFVALGIVVTVVPIWLRVFLDEPWRVPAICFTVILAARLRYGRAFRPFSFAIGTASVYVGIVVLLLVGPTLANATHQVSFDVVRWRQNTKGDMMWPVRLTMVDDLLKRQLLDRAPRDSVDRLLGPPDASPYSRGWDRGYYLGPERGMTRMDAEWLVLRFGPDGRVQAVHIART